MYERNRIYHLCQEKKKIIQKESLFVFAFIVCIKEKNKRVRITADSLLNRQLLISSKQSFKGNCPKDIEQIKKYSFKKMRKSPKSPLRQASVAFQL